MYGQVYLVTNTVNGKQYVGLTRQGLTKRWQEHLYTAKTKRTKSLVAKAIAKYGEEYFTMEPLFSALDKVTLVEAEKHFIRTLAPAYNLTNGGELTEGKRKPVWTEASKEKIRLGIKNYMANISSEDRIELLARRREAQLRAFEARGHKPQSAEHKAKLSAAREVRKLQPGYNAIQIARMAEVNRERRGSVCH